MKFELEEKVLVKATGRIGKVIHTKYEKYIQNDKTTESKRYEVHFGSYDKRWYFEEDLISDDEFDDKFESGLLNLLIDVYLSSGQYDLVKLLHNEKQKYTR